MSLPAAPELIQEAGTVLRTPQSGLPLFLLLNPFLRDAAVMRASAHTLTAVLMHLIELLSVGCTSGCDAHTGPAVLWRSHSRGCRSEHTPVCVFTVLQLQDPIQDRAGHRVAQPRRRQEQEQDKWPLACMTRRAESPPSS